MQLDRAVADALTGTGLLVEVGGRADVDVTSVTMDSRAVVPGTLFACVPGSSVDGHTFAIGAVSAGAVALLCERPLEVDVAQVVVTSTRRAVGRIAAEVYGQPSRDLLVVGVTGTNGKTTTTALLAGIFSAAGTTSAAIGTLTQARTTPEAPELQARLAELRDAGVRAIAMEVSSHALDQHRVDGMRFAAGVLTNVTQDHLDYHGTMERYFEAKASLFEPDRSPVAVVNRDDEWGRVLIGRLSGRGQDVVDYGIDDATDLELGPGGSTFGWEGTEIHLHLGGRFNVLNAIAAARTARVLGVDAAAIGIGLAAVDQVRGRFETVDAGQPFTVLVDYAHTPDGLVKVLTAAREITKGDLIVVFGAGGDRDRDKRPLMGDAAGRLADLTVITSDNPRGEDPGAIIQAVADGVPRGARVQVVPDRHDAIATALAVAVDGDVVVIAGKGHEQGQEVAGHVRPFDDAGVARDILARILSSRGVGRAAR